jgi:hypothetical protein
MLDDGHAPAALARLDSTEQSGGASANHDRVESHELLAACESQNIRKIIPVKNYVTGSCEKIG